MLAPLRLRSVRHALVIMLMILSGFIAVERAQSVINAVQHAMAIDHAAPALELAAADHGHDLSHGHDPTGGDIVPGAGDQDPAPSSHHHHSEGPQIAALISPVMAEIAVSPTAVRFTRTDTGSPQARIFGLERPPKPLSARA